MMMIGRSGMILLLPAGRAVIVHRSRITVMPEVHADPAADRREALHRNGEDQHGDRKHAEEISEHRADCTSDA